MRKEEFVDFGECVIFLSRANLQNSCHFFLGCVTVNVTISMKSCMDAGENVFLIFLILASLLEKTLSTKVRNFNEFAPEEKKTWVSWFRRCRSELEAV